DPQGNASTGLGIPAGDRRRNAYHALIGEVAATTTIQATAVPNLGIVPAGVDLSGAEIELAQQSAREFFLRRALEDLTGQAIDYVFIDCPPALGLLTVNALTAAHGVLVPLQCEFFALEGIVHLMRTIERVRTSFNPRLEVQGIVLTMFDRRNRLSELVASDVRSHFGTKVYETVIPRNVRVSEAPSHGRPVLLYDFNCPGSQAYLLLAREVLRREQTLEVS
ncbi:MAG: ParA family protein, partial [Parvularculaceae bacterium]|nr:ParA family protein [Parvularculaceae bacterium]